MVTNYHVHGTNHWRAVMRGNPHVRFGPEGAGKGPAPAGTSPASYRCLVGSRLGWGVLEDHRLRAVAGVALA